MAFQTRRSEMHTRRVRHGGRASASGQGIQQAFLEKESIAGPIRTVLAALYSVLILVVGDTIRYTTRPKIRGMHFIIHY